MDVPAWSLLVSHWDVSSCLGRQRHILTQGLCGFDPSQLVPSLGCTPFQLSPIQKQFHLGWASLNPWPLSCKGQLSYSLTKREKNALCCSRKYLIPPPLPSPHTQTHTYTPQRIRFEPHLPNRTFSWALISLIHNMAFASLLLFGVSSDLPWGRYVGYMDIDFLDHT